LVKIYLDSNVLISLIKEEIGKPVRLMYENAKLFFECCKKSKITLTISQLFLDEVKYALPLTEREILNYFDSIHELNYEFVEITKKDVKKSNKFNIHKADALHAAIAINNNCDYLVTWNIRDFKELKEIKIREPTDFI